MGEILIFKVISISNKFQEPTFWKEKSVEDMITFGPTAQAALVIFKLESFCC